MSVQGDITQFLQSLEPDVKVGYVPLTAEQVAEKTNVSREKVNKTLYNLMTRGKVELVRGPNGRSVIGYRNVSPAEGRVQRTTPKPDTGRVRQAEPVMLQPGQARPRGIATPMLDEYEAARNIFNRTVERLGPLMDGQFKSNPYAEEGIRLRDRLGLIEPQVSELQRELEQANRDLRALRKQHQSEMLEGALQSGALATHGD